MGAPTSPDGPQSYGWYWRNAHPNLIYRRSSPGTLACPDTPFGPGFDKDLRYSASACCLTKPEPGDHRLFDAVVPCCLSNRRSIAQIFDT